MSITLTTGIQVSINGASVENDISACVSGITLDYLAGVATFTLTQGSVISQSGADTFNVGVYASPVTVSINMGTGAWTSSNGLSGTASGALFIGFQTSIKNTRNALETFSAVTNAIMPGTVVNWT